MRPCLVPVKKNGFYPNVGRRPTGHLTSPTFKEANVRLILPKQEPTIESARSASILLKAFDGFRASPQQQRTDRPPMRSAEEVSLASGPNLGALHEKLLALRLDLVHGVMPRAERITLTAGDLEYLLVQLDTAIAFTRDMVVSEQLDLPRGRRPTTPEMT
jgi:hypothetical protein